VSEPHCLHLLGAERELLAECHLRRSYLAVCGELMSVSELPSSDCEPGCQREVVSCLACIRTANEHHYDAGVDVDCPPGVVVWRQR
jgi:hypothetical protein